MRNIFFVPLFLLCITASAGKYDSATKKILDEAVRRLTAYGGVSLDFIIINQPNTSNQTRTTGSMDILDRKFYLESSEMLSWYDGKTQWSMTPGDTEVNMSEPDAVTQQSMNPSILLQLYKKGFYYKSTQGKLTNGEYGYKIYLNADNKNQKIREMYIEITEKYQLVRISIREGKKNWMRIMLNKIQTGKQFSTDHFIFPTKKYPNVEVIDIR